MRLFVVCGSAPPSSVTWPVGVAMTTPHPPGPGFPFAAPSANTVIGVAPTVSPRRRFIHHRTKRKPRGLRHRRTVGSTEKRSHALPLVHRVPARARVRRRPRRARPRRAVPGVRVQLQHAGRARRVRIAPSARCVRGARPDAAPARIGSGERRRADRRCDVVVLAGEFAGRFFGRSGRSVTLEEMEEASCQSRCAGLFQPQEVFLLACNTVATKDEDSRTPREYLQVLLDHGFDQASAERVVELRYGPLGPSFRESLRRIFADVPRLYGFSSVAPRAELTAPRLARYFRAKGDYARWLDDAHDAARPNRELLAAFARTGLVQTSGLAPTERRAADRALVCRLYDDSRSVADRLDVVRTMVERPDFLSFVPTIEVFFTRHPPGAFGEEERARFARIQENAGARAQVLDLV